MMKDLIKKILKEEKLQATPQQLIKNLPKELKELLFKQWNVKQDTRWHPEGNTLKHIIVVIRRAYHHFPNDPNMIMSALFHDLGKIDTYSINPKTNQPTAYGHEDKSTYYVELFRDWIESFEGTDVDEIKFLVKNHMKVKPMVWDQMKNKKKEPIKSHPSFNKLMSFTDKLDGGGIDLKETINRLIKEETKDEYILEIPNLRFIPNADLETPEGKTETWNELLRLLNGKPFIFDDDLNLTLTDITSLGNLQSVNGFLSLFECVNLTSLGNLQSVNGGLSLHKCINLTSLGKLKSVNGNLYLYNCKNLTSLGNLQSVNGNLDLSLCKTLTSLENLQSVNGNLHLTNTPISKKYSEEEIRQMANIKGEILM